MSEAICGTAADPHVASLMRASVTGLDESIPFCVIHSPGTCFCTGSAQGRRLMGVVEDGPANLQKRDHIFGRVDIPHDSLTRSIVPAKGLRFGKAGVVTRPKTCSVSLLSCSSSGVEGCSIGEHAVQDHFCNGPR